ncbi:MAG: hypothetical protein J1F11_10865 [Oscillospiraceae bacterium]|nr:hypothetical protein [Oscillospiraceae bacterium]
MKKISIKKMLASLTAAAMVVSVMIASVNAESEAPDAAETSVTMTQEEDTTASAEETAAPGTEITSSEDGEITFTTPQEEEINYDDEIALTAAEGIEINETNFPDEAFREYISGKYDVDNDGTLSPEEISAVTAIIEWSFSNVSDLTGIKYFTSLNSLIIQGSKITSLDLEDCISLTTLNCGYNIELKSLNVKGCKNLSSLTLYRTQITSLDLSDCTGLSYISTQGSPNTYQMEMIDLDGAGSKILSELNKLNKYGFDVTKATNWSGAEYKNGALTINDRTISYTYDCGGGISFTPTIELVIPVNEITFPCDQLRNYLLNYYANYNSNDTIKDAFSPQELTRVTSIALTGNDVTDLTGIEYFSKYLTNININKCNLEGQTLDLSSFTALESFSGSYCGLKNVNLSGCTSLTYAEVYGHADTSTNPPISYGLLESIDVTGCTSLVRLDLDYNKLTEIYVKDCINLERLNLQYNKLTSIDVSYMPSLWQLDVYGNPLVSLNINGTKITQLQWSSPEIDIGRITNGTMLLSKLKVYDNFFDVLLTFNWLYNIGSGFDNNIIDGYQNLGEKPQLELNENYLSVKYNYEYVNADNDKQNRPVIFDPTIIFKIVPPGDLTVSKTVTGPEGEKDKDFGFTVTLDDKLISGTFGDMTFTKGVASFTLKDGESVTADGLPSGITYIVTESGSAGYTVSSENASGTIPENDTITAAFTNSKGQYPDDTPSEPAETTVTKPEDTTPDTSASTNSEATTTAPEAAETTTAPEQTATTAAATTSMQWHGEPGFAPDWYTGENVSADAGIKADDDELSSPAVAFAAVLFTAAIAGTAVVISKKRRSGK